MGIATGQIDERRDLLDRFIRLVEERRGHSLALAVEGAKIGDVLRLVVG